MCPHSCNQQEYAQYDGAAQQAANRGWNRIMRASQHAVSSERDRVNRTSRQGVLITTKLPQAERKVRKRLRSNTFPEKRANLPTPVHKPGFKREANERSPQLHR